MLTHKASKVVENVSLYTLGVVGQKILSFLYFWFLSSRFAPEVLGSYLWVLAMVGLFAIVSDLGLTPILTREAAKHEGDAPGLLRTALGLKVPLAVLSAAALWIAVALSDRPTAAFVMLGAGTVILLCDAFTVAFYAVLRARQRVQYEAAVLVLFQLIVFGTGAWLAVATHDLTRVIYALALGSAFNFLFMGWAVRRELKTTLRPAFDRPCARHLATLIPVFALGVIFTKIHAVADTVLLGYLADDRAVGLYSVPAKVVTALQTLLPGAFAAAIYPSMANFFVTSAEKLRALFERSLAYLFLLGLPISVGIALLVDQILSSIWPLYGDAAVAFVIMLIGLPAFFLTFPTGSLLNAAGRERRNTSNRALAAAGNIVLNLALIPFFGVVGAAVAFTASNILLLIVDFIPSRRIARPSCRYLARAGLGIGTSSVLLAGVVVALRHILPFPATIGIAALVYLIALVVTRTISREEWRALRQLVRRETPALEEI